MVILKIYPQNVLLMVVKPDHSLHTLFPHLIGYYKESLVFITPQIDDKIGLRKVPQQYANLNISIWINEKLTLKHSVWIIKVSKEENSSGNATTKFWNFGTIFIFLEWQFLFILTSLLKGSIANFNILLILNIKMKIVIFHRKT